MDLINGVSFHTGDIGSADFFHRIDSWENIQMQEYCKIISKDIIDGGPNSIADNQMC